MCQSMSLPSTGFISITCYVAYMYLFQVETLKKKKKIIIPLSLLIHIDVSAALTFQLMHKLLSVLTCWLKVHLPTGLELETTFIKCFH